MSASNQPTFVGMPLEIAQKKAISQGYSVKIINNFNPQPLKNPIKVVTNQTKENNTLTFVVGEFYLGENNG